MRWKCNTFRERKKKGNCHIQQRLIVIDIQTNVLIHFLIIGLQKKKRRTKVYETISTTPIPRGQSERLIVLESIRLGENGNRKHINNESIGQDDALGEQY